MFEKFVLVDGMGHLLGRLASVLAKELLNGQKVIVVRCEEINISGSLFRNRLIFGKFLEKNSSTNPKRGGPIHFRSPSKIFWRVVRGMLPHKTRRGAAALARLKVFEGMPHPYDKMKRQTVPAALRVLRLRPHRKFTRLGDLAASVGWSYNDLIGRLEAKRKLKSASWYTKRKQFIALRAKATKSIATVLKKVGEVNKSSKPPQRSLPGFPLKFKMPDRSKFKRPVNAKKKDKNLPHKIPKHLRKDVPKKEKPKKSKGKATTKAKPEAEKKTESTTAEGDQ